MSPRSVGNFLKSKFGLFVLFVAVLFSGLGIYGKHQADAREAAKLAAQNPKKVELGQVRLPLDKGLGAEFHSKCVHHPRPSLNRM